MTQGKNMVFAAFVVLQAIFYGADNVVMKVAYGEVSPLWCQTLRFGLAFALFMALFGKQIVKGLRGSRVSAWLPVGVVYAGYLSGQAQITAAGALALSLGIAIQNFPEGAIISLPLRAEGMGKARAFWGGVLSGIVEPIGAVLTILAASLIVPALPWLLGFAAGAMLYVVAAELLPTRGDSGPGALAFAAGFTVMMILDVALG